MASQRITIAKIGGAGAEVVLEWFRAWSAARRVDDPDLWSSKQWPEDMRQKADDFAKRLRTHGFAPPVVYFVEWADLWSMGDLFMPWMTPPAGPGPCGIKTSQNELFAYGMPDSGRLARSLADVGPQQFTETDLFISRLLEAIEAWEALVDRSVIVVLRRVVNRTFLDDEVTQSLQSPPAWLS